MRVINTNHKKSRDLELVELNVVGFSGTSEIKMFSYFAKKLTVLNNFKMAYFKHGK